MFLEEQVLFVCTRVVMICCSLPQIIPQSTDTQSLAQDTA